MHAFSTQLICLLVAQFGADGGFPLDPRPAGPAVQSVVPATSDPAPYRQPAPSSEVGTPADTAAHQNAATVPVHSAASLSRAEALVEQFVHWDRDAIEGESVTLVACVQRAAATNQQAAAIDAYWQLCASIGHYTQAEQELVVLAGLTPQFEFEQTQIRAAARSVEARRAQARVDLQAAQEQLAEVTQLPDETLPLPADLPFVGKYQTRLTTMYAGRTVPRQVRSVDRALPHQLKLIEHRAEAVDANARLLHDLAGLYQQGQVPLSVLLGTCRELSDQQDAFLDAVVKYNRQIAAYSQTVVGSRVPATSLVATLIRQPSATVPRIFRDDNVQPAAAQQTEPRSPSGNRRSANEAAGDVRPAFERNPARPPVDRPEPTRQPFDPGEPTTSRPPAFDPNGAFQIDDGT